MPDFTAFLVAVLPLSVGITKFVDLVRNAIDTNDTMPKALWNVLAFVAGVAMCLGWSINLAPVAGLPQSSLAGTAGQILTGLVIGAMGSFWHEPLAAWSARSKGA